MATPIKAVPILTGTLADDFVRRAEENERKPRRILSEEREKKIAEIMRRSREFVPSWLK
ncbi:MAG: hypothetical protein K2I64_05165 [Muribaculaceae bacterium]|nr:hypothetical protein [Muribaculaceae bacterium]